MKHILKGVLVVLGLYGYCTAYSQKAVLSLSDIRAFVEVEGNYESLVKRVVAGDPDLTLNDYALAYYGFSFTEGYSPYSTEELHESLPPSLLRESDLQEHISICHDYLERVPVNIAALGLLHDVSRWFDENRQPDEIYRNRMRALLEVVKASGKGTYESPFRIVFFKDALSVISSEYFELAGSKVQDGRLFVSVSFPADRGKRAGVEEYVFSLDLCKPDVPEIMEFFLLAGKEANVD